MRFITNTVLAFIFCGAITSVLGTTPPAVVTHDNAETGNKCALGGVIAASIIFVLAAAGAAVGLIVAYKPLAVKYMRKKTSQEMENKLNTHLNNLELLNVPGDDEVPTIKFVKSKNDITKYASPSEMFCKDDTGKSDDASNNEKAFLEFLRKSDKNSQDMAVLYIHTLNEVAKEKNMIEKDFVKSSDLEKLTFVQCVALAKETQSRFGKAIEFKSGKPKLKAKQLYPAYCFMNKTFGEDGKKSKDKDENKNGKNEGKNEDKKDKDGEKAKADTAAKTEKAEVKSEQQPGDAKPAATKAS